MFKRGVNEMTAKQLTWRELSLEFVTGLFFVVAMIVLGVGTIILSKDKWSKHQVSRTVEFTSVAGLGSGDRVLVRGVEVGRVRRIQLAGDRVLVDFTTRADVRLFRDCVVSIGDTSFLGGKNLAIESGTTRSGELPPTEKLVGLDPEDMFKKFNGLLVKIEKEKIVENLSGIAGDARSMVGDMKSGKGTLGKLITDDSLHTQASEMISTIKKAGEQTDNAVGEIKGMVLDVRAGKGTLGKLVTDDGLYSRIDEMMTSMRKAGDTVDVTASELKGMTADLRAGKGTLGKLMTDDSVYQHYNQLGQNMDLIIADIRQGKGTIGRLVYDDGAGYDKIMHIFDDMGEISDSLRNGKGTLGLLINDPALYNDIHRGVLELRKAVEDFREQSTWSSFGSLMFNAM
jgi:phospholipid/cholesterol/gamma-HCH transport system substrate-binding protein